MWMDEGRLLYARTKEFEWFGRTKKIDDRIMQHTDRYSSYPLHDRTITNEPLLTKASLVNMFRSNQETTLFLYGGDPFANVDAPVYGAVAEALAQRGFKVVVPHDKELETMGIAASCSAIVAIPFSQLPLDGRRDAFEFAADMGLPCHKAAEFLPRPAIERINFTKTRDPLAKVYLAKDGGGSGDEVDF